MSPLTMILLFFQFCSTFSMNLFLLLTKWHHNLRGHLRWVPGIHFDHLLPCFLHPNKWSTAYWFPLKTYHHFSIPTMPPQVTIISPLFVSQFTNNRQCELTVCRAKTGCWRGSCSYEEQAGLAFKQTPTCLMPVLSHVGKTTAMQYDKSKEKYLIESGKNILFRNIVIEEEWPLYRTGLNLDYKEKWEFISKEQDGMGLGAWGEWYRQKVNGKLLRE